MISTSNITNAFVDSSIPHSSFLSSFSLAVFLFVSNVSVIIIFSVALFSFNFDDGIIGYVRFVFFPVVLT